MLPLVDYDCIQSASNQTACFLAHALHGTCQGIYIGIIFNILNQVGHTLHSVTVEIASVINHSLKGCPLVVRKHIVFHCITQIGHGIIYTLCKELSL